MDIDDARKVVEDYNSQPVLHYSDANPFMIEAITNDFKDWRVGLPDYDGYEEIWYTLEEYQKDMADRRRLQSHYYHRFTIDCELKENCPFIAENKGKPLMRLYEEVEREMGKEE